MKEVMMLRVRFPWIIGVLAVLLLMPVGAIPVQAQGSNGASSGFVSRSSASPWTSLINRVTRVPSPTSCVLQADHVHKSSRHNEMAGKVRGSCPIQIPRMSHYAQLQEMRWTGWRHIGYRDVKEGSNVMVLIARAHDICRHNPGGIRVRGYGHIVDTDGVTYYADHIVVSPAKTNPCRLP